MICLKAKLKDAEKAKKKIIEQNILDLDRTIEKDDDFIYFPIINKPDVADFAGADTGLEIIEKENSKKKTPRTRDLRTLLKDKLTDVEFEKLKTAFDTVGSIAILEIDEELRKKEKIIAQALLDSNKNIKTVVRKDEKHDGEFRTQKMQWLAGVNTKETIYKENGVQLMLDVEKVYFSPRLSTDRKRIMQQVLPGEDVLVMFSGCAPYPCVLAKNTKARSIVGIEINPEGHKYGLKNLELNKIKNTILINADVKLAIPKILQKIIGLKSSIKDHQFDKRIFKNPSIFEFHLENNDLFEKTKLEKKIMLLKSQGVQVILHVPFNHDGIEYNLEHTDISSEEKMLKELGELCKKHFLRAVIHINNTDDVNPNYDEELLVNNIKKFKQYFDYFYFENLIKTFTTKEEIIRISKKAGIKNLCVDIVHMMIVYKDTNKIVDCIRALSNEFNLYFHVADHDFVSHTCEIGAGKIDMKKVLPLVTYGVAEVKSKSEDNPVEMLRSYDHLAELSYLKKFDRILMPLPKSAGDFLDTAILASKKGTIIHLYNFLHEDKFEEAERLVDDACKRAGRTWKKLALVKCGQHAPRVFRICLDFEMMD